MRQLDDLHVDFTRPLVHELISGILEALLVAVRGSFLNKEVKLIKRIFNFLALAEVAL